MTGVRQRLLPARRATHRKAPRRSATTPDGTATLLASWFLLATERGNPSTRLDESCPPGEAWTAGNHVEVLVDGAAYFRRLASVLGSVGAGDEVHFTDWRGDADERLDEHGPSVAPLLAEASGRGADVRGLLWRSHSDRLSFSAKDNRRLSKAVNKAGGEVLLDERVRRGGSHHQKLLVVRYADATKRDVAFVGGIDLSHGRRDDRRHHGDPQPIKLDSKYGGQPAWHDVQLEITGPAVSVLDETFRERWEDPTPLNYANRLRAAISRSTGRDRVASPLPPPAPVPEPVGSQCVQVLRTYPANSPRYPFAADGERSVARAFAKAVDRARTLIYIEDQYFWSVQMATLLAEALQRHPTLQLVVVVPRFPDKDGRLSGPPARGAQGRAMSTLLEAGGERVGFYNLENDLGRPIYVHAKVCIIDDVWATVGSDNLNRRSWTHDSETSCAVLDGVPDVRPPLDPGGLGDRARPFARDLRIALWSEHLGLDPQDPALLDNANATALWRRHAALAASHDAPLNGTWPRARVRAHEIAGRQARGWWSSAVYRLVFDPDGRPLRLRLGRSF